MSLWAGGELAKAQLSHGPADRRLVQADAELLKDPRDPVLQPPANHAVNGRDGSALHDAGQSSTLFIIQLGGAPGCLTIDQSIWTSRVEPQHPIANRLETNPADPSRLYPGAPVIDHGQGQKAARLSRIRARLCQPPQVGSVKIRPKRKRSTHGEPPSSLQRVRHHPIWKADESPLAQAGAGEVRAVRAAPQGKPSDFGSTPNIPASSS